MDWRGKDYEFLFLGKGLISQNKVGKTLSPWLLRGLIRWKGKIWRVELDSSRVCRISKHWKISSTHSTPSTTNSERTGRLTSTTTLDQTTCSTLKFRLLRMLISSSLLESILGLRRQYSIHASWRQLIRRRPKFIILELLLISPIPILISAVVQASSNQLIQEIMQFVRNWKQPNFHWWLSDTIPSQEWILRPFLMHLRRLRIVINSSMLRMDGTDTMCSIEARDRSMHWN